MERGYGEIIFGLADREDTDNSTLAADRMIGEKKHAFVAFLFYQARELIPVRVWGLSQVIRSKHADESGGFARSQGIFPKLLQPRSRAIDIDLGLRRKIAQQIARLPLGQLKAALLSLECLHAGRVVKDDSNFHWPNREDRLRQGQYQEEKHKELEKKNGREME